MNRLKFFTAAFFLALTVFSVNLQAQEEEAAEEIVLPYSLLGEFEDGFPLLFDQADLLNGEQFSALERRLSDIAESCSCSVYIVTVRDYRDYSDNVEEFSEEIRTGYDMGNGEERNTILLVLSMGDRSYDVCCYGDFAKNLISGYRLNSLLDGMLRYFKQNDFYNGFLFFAQKSEYYILVAEAEEKDSSSGKYEYNDSTSFLNRFIFYPRSTGGLIVSAVLGLIAALITFLCAKKSADSRLKKDIPAFGYVQKNSLNFTLRTDDYSHTSESRTYSPQNTQSHGRSGYSGSSGGHSHSSGHF